MNATAGESRRLLTSHSLTVGESPRLLTSHSLRATIGPFQANRPLFHYVIGISGILPFNRNVTLQTFLSSACTVSHGSIMPPSCQPRVFARLARWQFFVFYTNVSSIYLHRSRKLQTKLGVFREESETIAYCYDRKRLNRTMLFVFLVPLGSVPELPAESCAEIKASEGEDAVSGNYWIDSIKPGEVVLARCDMSKLGKSTFGVLAQFSTCTSSNKPLL